MRRFPRNRGFTLVELMIVVAIISVLAALAIYGVRRYMATAKTAEAKGAVGSIARLAVAVFEREVSEAELVGGVAGGLSKPSVNRLCTTATNPVPNTIPKAKKYQPSDAVGVDFHTGDSKAGWICLSYLMTTPIYYQYTYRQGGGYVSPALGGPDPGADGFEAAAQGDIDDDNNRSTFARSGAVVGKNLQVATQVFVHEEFE